MKQLTTFLSLLLPQLGPVLTQVPNLLTLIRDVFKRVGGTDVELDAILDKNKILIDKLGTPDVYRRVPPTQPTPAPEPPPVFAYSRDLSSAPKPSQLVAGDEIYHRPPMEITGDDGKMGFLPEAWHVWSPVKSAAIRKPGPPFTLLRIVD